MVFQHEDELRLLYDGGNYMKLFTKNSRRKFKKRGIVERKRINTTHRTVLTWDTKRFLELNNYPCWLELPLEMQDDVDLLNLVRLHKGEPEYESYESVFIELSLDDLLESDT